MTRIDDRRPGRVTRTGAGAAPAPRAHAHLAATILVPLRRARYDAARVADSVPWIARQTLLVLALVGFYFVVRGQTEGSAAVAVAHAHQLEHFEARLGIDVEGQLQSTAARWDPVIDFANWIYIWGHWPVIVTTLVWLAIRHRRAYLRLRDAMAISGALGMIVFVSYPAAPPRLVVDGLVDTVTERSSAYRVLQPPLFTDRYAAMPSLHVGWDLLVGIAIATTATLTVIRLIGWLLPPLMALAVLVTANHYVVDVIAGVTLVLIGHGCALQLERRRERRQAEPGIDP